MLCAIRSVDDPRRGIDNTIEAILMVGVAATQVLLFALGAAGVRPLGIFNSTEFLLRRDPSTRPVVSRWECHTAP
jgi:hypothetical protein